MACCNIGKIAGQVRRAAIHWSLTMPATYNLVQKWRKPEDVGLGDTLQNAAEALGAEAFAKLAANWGFDCKCEEERQFWNELRPYD